MDVCGRRKKARHNRKLFRDVVVDLISWQLWPSDDDPIREIPRVGKLLTVNDDHVEEEDDDDDYCVDVVGGSVVMWMNGGRAVPQKEVKKWN